MSPSAGGTLLRDTPHRLGGGKEDLPEEQLSQSEGTAWSEAEAMGAVGGSGWNGQQLAPPVASRLSMRHLTDAS